MEIGKVSLVYPNEHGFSCPREYLEAVNTVNRKKILLTTPVYVQRFRLVQIDGQPKQSIKS
jgi:hypothetical protein